MPVRGECVGIVSGKGGTGKTSLTAAVGAALARMGRRVLCVDCAAGMRGLDLAMGLTDAALMDLSDAARGRCTLAEAAAEHPKQPGLFLLNAPARDDIPDPESVSALLEEARRRFDYCLLDAPAGFGPGFRLAVRAADRAIVVSVMDPPALRAAQRAAMELDRFPDGAAHLVVNRVRRRLLSQMRVTIDDAMDQAGLPLLGLIPEDDALPLSLARALPVTLSAPDTPAAAACRNLAGRITGRRVPLLNIRR